MVPAGFVLVDELPVTASGKVDRQALAAFAQSHAVERTGESPRDDVERTIAAIFQRLLKQRSIGRDDDFFVLGGDSLSLMELQTRLRDAFGVALASIHEDPTVAAIAAQVRAARATGAAPTRAIPVLFPLRERGSAPPLFLVHGRLGQALVSPHFLNLLGDDQPVWAFQAHGLDGLDAPHPTIEAMAAHYVAEMRKRRPEGPYFIGALCAGALIAIAMARMLNDAGEIVLPLLLLDPPERPFAMANAAMTEERVLGRLKKKRVKGTSVAPLDDPAYARASVRVAQAFELAIRRHQPVPYEGPVYMFRSSARIAESPPAAMTKLFAGKVERFEVAATHREILDAHNALFARSLAQCLAAIRGAAEITGPNRRSRLDADFVTPPHS
jgi:acyl carrier protein